MSDHGSESAYKRHQRNHTSPCVPCKHAHATAEAERRARRKESHGTDAGLRLHRRLGTPVCDPCLDAACYAELWRTRRYLGLRTVAA